MRSPRIEFLKIKQFWLHPWPSTCHGHSQNKKKLKKKLRGKCIWLFLCQFCNIRDSDRFLWQPLATAKPLWLCDGCGSVTHKCQDEEREEKWLPSEQARFFFINEFYYIYRCMTIITTKFHSTSIPKNRLVFTVVTTLPKSQRQKRASFSLHHIPLIRSQARGRGKVCRTSGQQLHACAGGDTYHLHSQSP